MEEALYDTEAFILRQALARAEDVRRRNTAAATAAAAAAAAAQAGSAQQAAPGAMAAATEMAERAVRRAWKVMYCTVVSHTRMHRRRWRGSRRAVISPQRFLFCPSRPVVSLPTNIGAGLRGCPGWILLLL